jgi:hypothetical protein
MPGRAPQDEVTLWWHKEKDLMLRSPDRGVSKHAQRLSNTGLTGLSGYLRRGGVCGFLTRRRLWLFDAAASRPEPRFMGVTSGGFC